MTIQRFEHTQVTNEITMEELSNSEYVEKFNHSFDQWKAAAFLSGHSLQDFKLNVYIAFHSPKLKSFVRGHLVGLLGRWQFPFSVWLQRTLDMLYVDYLYALYCGIFGWIPFTR